MKQTFCLLIYLFATLNNAPAQTKKFSKADSLQAIMNRYTAAGIPGVSLAVYTEAEGWWAGAAGYAKVETKTPMNTRHLQYIQSVSKTYMAVVILKLYEEKRIELDAPITRYLPRQYSRYIPEAEKVTVRMLLSHTSGVPEYQTHPKYISWVLLHPTTIFPMEKAITFLEGEPMQFAAGSKYLYTNTNFLLLAMIADAITGDHAKYMSEKIFRPLQLQQTYYHHEPGYLHYANLPDCYWDALDCGRPANITELQRISVAATKGDDGIVCTPTDAVHFLKALMEGKLLQDTTLALMQHWVDNSKGQHRYGLGLAYYSLEGLVGYGHSGGGIGAGCILLYVPSKKTYLFLGCNLGVLVAGKLPEKADALKNEILVTLLMGQ